MKPRIIFKCLPNYADDGKNYMFPKYVRYCYYSGYKTLANVCTELSIIYGPIVLGQKSNLDDSIACY